MAHLSLRLLGTYDVQLAEQPVTNFRSVKNQALLAYLVAEADRPHSRAALAGLLWPEQPDSQALLNLRQTLFRLRNLLQNDEAHPPFLQINATAVHFNRQSNSWFDGAAFVELLAMCSHHARTVDDHEQNSHRRHCPACSERLAQAVALYRGEFMHGIYIDESPALEEWLLLRREWFHHQALAALQDLAAWHEGQRHYARAYDYARRQVELDPLREEAHQQLMRALALDGKRSEALAQYEACCTVLYQELGVGPSAETEALLQQIEQGTVGDTEQANARQAQQNGAGVLPGKATVPTPSTPFFGREGETAKVRAMLLDPTHRLVTLLGQGGVGKSRLALAAATDLTGAFADGVWFVALDGVESEAGLVATLAAALGFHFSASGEPQQQLLTYLHQREALLILDNFEQLISSPPLTGMGPEVTLIQQLLTAAPRLKFLLTSRARLTLQSEQVLSLTGLPIPALDQPALSDAELVDQAQGYSSIRLFVERAQRSGLGFTLNPETAPHVLAICRLVEGLPLGIELAAAWTDHYSCAEIAETIRTTLDFLESPLHDALPRHRSLRAAFDYSWRLLAPAEQQALAQMSIFRAPYSREAAQAVAQVALPQLMALVNKSLVRTVGPGRYALHDLVRQFAGEAANTRQQASAEHPVAEHPVAERHAVYYLRLVRTQEGLFGQEPQKAVALLLQEIEHIRQAWHWAVAMANTAELHAALPNLARAFDLAGLYREAATTWQSTLAEWGQSQLGGQVPAIAHKAAAPRQPLTAATPLWIQLQIEMARMQRILGDHAQATLCAEAALAQLLPDRTELIPLRVAALQQLGIAHYRQGDHAAALPLLEEAVHLAQQSTETRLTADCLLSLGEVQMYQGDNAAQQSFAAALARYRHCADRRGEGAALHSLGLFAHMRSEFTEGKRWFEEALRIHRTLGDRHLEAMTLLGLASFYGQQANYAESDRYAQQTLKLARTIGYRIGEVQALTSLGVTQMHQGVALPARTYFEEALLIARQSGYLRGEGALLNNLGNLASDAGDYAAAESHYRAALAVARQSGDRYFTCARLHNLGNMRRFQGDYVGAQALYSEAVVMAAAIGDRWIEGSAHADLALCCDFLSAEAEAWHHATHALDRARAIGDRWCEAKALAALGWLTAKRGAAEGLTLIAEAIDVAQKNQEIGIEGAATARHGFALLRLGQPDAAVSAFAASVALRRALNDDVQVNTSRAGLAAALWATGQRERAYAEVLQILAAIGARPVGVADDPMRVYGICYQILAAVSDPQATALQQRAWQHMTEQAAAISSATQRARFLRDCTEQLGPQTFNF